MHHGLFILSCHVLLSKAAPGNRITASDWQVSPGTRRSPAFSETDQLIHENILEGFVSAAYCFLGVFVDVWILSRHLGFKMQKVFLFALHECLGVLLHWDHHNSISRLDIFGKEPGCKSVRGLVYVFSAPRPGCVVALLWGCGCQRSHLGQARGLLFFFSSPVWTLRPQLPLQDPFLPSKQMFSGHLSGFVGWAALWILVFSRILAQQFLSTLSSLLFSRCFSSFFWLTSFSLSSVENWPELPCPPWPGVHMKNEWLWPCSVRKSNTCLIHSLPGLISVTKSPTLARHTAVLVAKDEWCRCHEAALLAPVFLSPQAEGAIAEESGDLASVLALPLAHSLPWIRKLLPLLGLCFFFFFF